MKRLLWIILAVSLLGASSVAGAGEATDLVKQTSERMLAALESKRSQIDAKPVIIYSLVDQILVPHFDFERITRAAVGKSWKQASSTQQGELTREFQQVLVRTYATSLLKYSGEEIRYLPEKSGSREGTVTVSTQVREGGAPPIPIDYSLYRNGAKWLVYDVKIDGVSLVSNYRSSFASQVRSGGIDGLIKSLKQKNSKGTV